MTSQTALFSVRSEITFTDERGQILGKNNAKVIHKRPFRNRAVIQQTIKQQVTERPLSAPKNEPLRVFFLNRCCAHCDDSGSQITNKHQTNKQKTKLQGK